MNLILLSRKDFSAPNTVKLSDRRHKHIHTILKTKIGDQLSVGLIDGKIGNGTITDINTKSVSMTVSLNAQPPKPLNLTLILALPRPIVLKRLLSAIASLGVKQIYLIQSNRVEKSYWKSPTLNADTIKEQFILGLEQAKDTVMPQIHMKKRFKPFMEDEIPNIIKNSNAILAHPGNDPFKSLPKSKHCVLVVGPEGGFVDFEVDLMRKAGFKSVNFHDRILRVETAVPFIISKFA